MKKCLLLITVLLLGAARGWAGERDKRIGISAGVLYPRIFNVSLQYEWETSYHNAWEFYADYATQWDKCATCGRVCMDSFWKERYALGVGLAYKPVFHRGKNSVGRVRIGSDVGTNTRSFALGVEGGIEYAWTFRGGSQFFVQQKNEVTFWAKPRFKYGALAGFRFLL